MISINNYILPTFVFSGGEIHFKLLDKFFKKDKEKISYYNYLEIDKRNPHEIVVSLENAGDIIELMLFCNALKYYKSFLKSDRFIFYIPYLPYARQDRICQSGEPFSLEMLIKILLMLKEELDIYFIFYDIHSNQIRKLGVNFDHKNIGCIINYNNNKINLISDHESDPPNCIVSPDIGAVSKIDSGFKYECDSEHLIFNKERDLSRKGKIKKIYPIEKPLKEYNRVVILDDICDGGATFVEIAKILHKSSKINQLDLYVTHGIFSKGFNELLQYFDNIYCWRLVHSSNIPLPSGVKLFVSQQNRMKLNNYTF